MSEKLVAFFSASGVTAAPCAALEPCGRSRSFRDQAAVPYTSADLDWTNASSRSSVEMKNPASRPRNCGKAAEHGGLRRGLPRLPDLVVCRAHHHQHLPGKLRFFRQDHRALCHFRRQPMGRTLEILRPLCNASVKWLPAKMLNGATDSDLNAWLKSLKLD